MMLSKKSFIALALLASLQAPSVVHAGRFSDALAAAHDGVVRFGHAAVARSRELGNTVIARSRTLGRDAVARSRATATTARDGVVRFGHRVIAHSKMLGRSIGAGATSFATSARTRAAIMGSAVKSAARRYATRAGLRLLSSAAESRSALVETLRRKEELERKHIVVDSIIGKINTFLALDDDTIATLFEPFKAMLPLEDPLVFFTHFLKITEPEIIDFFTQPIDELDVIFTALPNQTAFETAFENAFQAQFGVPSNTIPTAALQKDQINFTLKHSFNSLKEGLMRYIHNLETTNVA